MGIQIANSINSADYSNNTNEHKNYQAAPANPQAYGQGGGLTPSYPQNAPGNFPSNPIRTTTYDPKTNTYYEHIQMPNRVIVPEYSVTVQPQVNVTYNKPNVSGGEQWNPNPSLPGAAWKENVTYNAGDVVTAGNGHTYKALRTTTGEGPWSHTAPGSPYPSGSYGPPWVEYDAGHGDPSPPQGPGLKQGNGDPPIHPDGSPYPVWNETNAYHPGEIVTAGNGDSYIALRSTTGEGPWSHTAPGSPYPLGPYGPAWAAYDAGHGSPAPPQGPQLQLGPAPPRPFRPGEFQPGTPSPQLQPPDRFVPGEFPAGASRAGAS